VKPGLAVDSKNLLERMLEKDVKVGTSTPKADPSGDYAFEVFRKADAIKAGAQAELEKKALQLTGSANSVPAPAGRTVYGWHVSEGRADIFLTYCTNALVAQKENPDQRIVDLPDNLAVGADYGLTVITGAPSAARHLADFIVSPEGQKILERHGFTPETKSRVEADHETQCAQSTQRQDRRRQERCNDRPRPHRYRRTDADSFDHQ
jgi:ABC-type molybdate transport system substrate-binding protein